jgi:hypothetical protein
VPDAYVHGLSRAQLRNPALQRPFHGVRFAPGIRGEHIDRCRAFSLRMPGEHVFSHVTAAAIHGMPLPAALQNGPLHVMSPATVRATKAQGTIGHCAALRPRDVVERYGVRVTSAERTWCDLAALLDLDDLVAAGDLLLWHERPVTTVERLRDAVATYPSQRGRVNLRHALPLLSAHSRSRPESLVRVALIRSHLPDPVPNHEVYLRSIRREIDLAYPKYKVGLEYQGDHHRTDVAQWRGDIRRGNDAVDEGWSMIYFTGDDLADLPGILMRTERRLRARGWPAVR